MYWTFDELGFLTGASETEVPNSTAIPYPDKNAFYQFAQGDWHLVFGITSAGNVTVTEGWVTDLPQPKGFLGRNPFYDRKRNARVDVGQLTLDPAYPNLSPEALSAVFAQAKIVTEASKIYAVHGGTELLKDYAVYRMGDDHYVAAAWYWISNEGRTFTAKIFEGAMTDLYEICHGEEEVWKVLDHDTFIPMSVHIDGGATQIDAITREVIQVNQETEGLNGVPDDFADEMIAKGIPYVNGIFRHNDVPGVGRMVAFTVNG